MDSGRRLKKAASLREPWGPPSALARFLATGDPPVLVSFGATPDRNPQRTTRLLLDALALAGRRGLIVRGPYLDPHADLGPDVALARHLETLPEADLDKPTGWEMAPTVGALFVLIANHPMMHAGQFVVVRRKLGKPVVI